MRRIPSGGSYSANFGQIKRGGLKQPFPGVASSYIARLSIAVGEKHPVLTSGQGSLLLVTRGDFLP